MIISKLTEDEKLKKIVERFSFSYEEAKSMGFVYNDLNEIYEIIPNEEYLIRLNKGNRSKKVVHGSLLKAIKEKQKLIKDLERRDIEKPKIAKYKIDLLTFEEVSELTIEYLIKLGETTDAIDLNTVFDYKYRMKKYLFPFFEKDSKISKLNDEKIKEFINYMFNKKKDNSDNSYSISTIEKAYSTLSWIIRYCSEISDPPLLPENYTNRILLKTLIPKGRGKRKRKDRSHSLQEIQDLIQTLNTKANIRLKSMVNVVIDVGCRGEELSGLKWKSIDEKTGKVDYLEAITSKISKKDSEKYSGVRSKTLKSIHSYRNNYLTSETLKYLKQLRIFQRALGLPAGDDDYIFTVWDENKILSPISLADEYADFRKKYGFKNIPLYDIRHMVSNVLLESGMSPKDVAQYMGNTPRTLLESYTEIREDTKIEMQNVIKDKFRSNNHKTFEIESIVSVLNSNESVKNRNDYELLDFINNSVVNHDDEYIVIQNAKKLILDQYPAFKTFCNADDSILSAKLETYKAFNSGDIEIYQNSIYFGKNIKI